jgi:D-inositol-3-phosphate glycosyltransferase
MATPSRGEPAGTAGDSLPRPRLLVVGRARPGTGYARVLHSLLEHLAPAFRVLHFGIDHRGGPLDLPWPVRPNTVNGDLLGEWQIDGVLAEFRPHVALYCHDAWLLQAHAAALEAHRPRPAVVYYLPVEWPPAPAELEPFRGVRHLVTYTGYGRARVEEAFHALGGPVPPLHVIPHGIDTGRFHPLGPPREARRAARARLFPDRPELLDGFLVLNANRNCPRKAVDVTLRAFALFARGRSDAWLCLHMGMRDSGVDVAALVRELGIGHRVLCTTGDPYPPRVPDEELNLVYNACDVGINTATAEGWGLVAFEHAATGAAQVVPDHGVTAELWEEAGVLAPADPGPGGTCRVSVEGAAVALGRLYDDRALLRERSAAALRAATAPELAWSAVAARWLPLLRDAAHEAAARWHASAEAAVPAAFTPGSRTP